MAFTTTASILSRASRAAGRLGVIVNEHTLDRRQTRQHVDILSRVFDFIHHDDLAERLERPRARPFCLLTFDDGKRSCYTETAPELERLGVPAVFYVTTGFLGSRAPLWFDRYEALLGVLEAIPPGLEPAAIKELPLDLVHERIDRACAEMGVVLSMRDDRIGPMRWQEARELSGRGFTVGAHGVQHAVLTRERERDALRQVEQSIADVTRETGRRCETFAFPNGNYTARLARHALASGARTVMTTEPTWVGRQHDPWRLPRIQLFPSQRRFRIELKLAVAATGRLLENPDGTGRLYRRIARMHDGSSSRPREPRVRKRQPTDQEVKSRA